MGYEKNVIFQYIVFNCTAAYHKHIGTGTNNIISSTREALEDSICMRGITGNVQSYQPWLRDMMEIVELDRM